MSFQTPRSIEEMLAASHRREYLMPAIQCEFVWSADQITKLAAAESLPLRITPPDLATSPVVFRRVDGTGGDLGEDHRPS